MTLEALPPESLYYRTHFEPSPGTLANAVPIVFLHGLMGFAANWGKIWPNFYHEHPVLTLDQRGHGKSAKPQTGYSPSHYAADLAGLLDHLGWEKAHIVGHSMGGRAALAFADEYRARTASLTMEDSGAEDRPAREAWIRNLLQSIPTPFPDRASVKKFFDWKFQDDPLTGAFLQSNLESQPDGTLNWRFHAPGMIETVVTGRVKDAMQIFRSLTVPTLLVKGGASRDFPAEEAARMVASRPGVTLVTVPGAGHYVHSEKPAEFSAALSAFLKHAESLL